MASTARPTADRCLKEALGVGIPGVCRSVVVGEPELDWKAAAVSCLRRFLNHLRKESETLHRKRSGKAELKIRRLGQNDRPAQAGSGCFRCSADWPGIGAGSSAIFADIVRRLPDCRPALNNARVPVLAFHGSETIHWAPLSGLSRTGSENEFSEVVQALLWRDRWSRVSLVGLIDTRTWPSRVDNRFHLALVS